MRQLISVLFLFTSVYVSAQKTEDPDSTFNRARNMAYAKNYSQSLALLHPLCKQYPANSDYSIFMGRVFAWSGKYDSAVATLKPIVSKEPKNADALDALTDALTWSGKLTDARSYCDTGIDRFGTKPPLFWLKKAKVLHQLNDDKDALNAVNVYLQVDSANKEAQQLKKDIEGNNKKNQVSVSYINSSFWNPSSSSWNFGYIEYLRQITGCPLIARLNYGSEYNITGYMMEVDAYPVIRKGTYLYLNSGFSPDEGVFPTFKAGGDIYQSAFKHFEVSLGARYMNFSGDAVDIYTGYIGAYYGNWWFAYRNYLVAPQGQIFDTHSITVRRYLADKDSYITFYGIYGVTPYEFTFIETFSQLNATRIGVDAQFKIANAFLIRPMLMFENEEYYPGETHLRIDAQLTLALKF